MYAMDPKPQVSALHSLRPRSCRAPLTGRGASHLHQPLQPVDKCVPAPSNPVPWRSRACARIIATKLPTAGTLPAPAPYAALTVAASAGANERGGEAAAATAEGGRQYCLPVAEHHNMRRGDTATCGVVTLQPNQCWVAGDTEQQACAQCMQA